MVHRLFFAWTWVMSSLFSLAQTNKLPAEKVDSLFSRYDSNTPGVAVGILKNGEFIFQKGYGVSNLEYSTPISEKTVFHIASVSKQFTAFAIYLLAAEDHLSLEDDVRKYLPELPQYENPIKIEHLLAHTSGLREQFALLTLAGWDMTDRITKDHILKLLFSQRQLNFQPGSQLGYCNSGYLLLAEIIERITGMTFRAFCAKKIFEPLEMTNTQFYDDAKMVVKNRAYSYELENGAYVKKKLNYSFAGPTSLFTNVEDLGKWANNFQSPIVGSEDLIKKFNEVSELNSGELAIWRIIEGDTLHHAKGQFLRNYRGLNVFKHGGHDAGYRTFLARFPEEGLTIITLSNDEHYEIFARGMEIATFYLQDQFEEEVSSLARAHEVVDQPKTYLTEELDQYIGSYSSDELDTRYHIVKKENTLIIQHQRLDDIVLNPTEVDTFSGVNHYWAFTLKFLRMDGKISGFEISNFGVKNLQFKRER